MSAFGAIFSREAGLAWAGGGGPAGPAAFFLGAITLAPLAIGPAADLLVAVGPGIMGFAALLSVLQSADRLFGDDHADGTAELYLLSGLSLPWLVLAKVMGQALATLWPLPVIGLLGAMMYGVPVLPACVGALALLAAIPALSLIAGFAGALAAGVRRSGLLIALIATPMMVPVLIFAAGAGRSALAGDERALANLLLTVAVSLGTTALAPFGIVAALRSRLG
ncbi:heme exporter protein CcmB [Maricaulis maris]|jgi:heme exporter protein B|uniref:Heme exporter protein B n=1 Tax=Maricaulis maris (strain MCS10) TaxID=394221 RepID=Q0AKQ3_MARMM|nr:heme exporter protein CcmB [Maricaulis maris]ABI67140.1 cytochrome c-type biogenesis protein CcmB [Maricaulis maris MCS10]